MVDELFERSKKGLTAEQLCRYCERENQRTVRGAEHIASCEPAVSERAMEADSAATGVPQLSAEKQRHADDVRVQG